MPFGRSWAASPSSTTRPISPSCTSCGRPACASTPTITGCGPPSGSTPAGRTTPSTAGPPTTAAPSWSQGASNWVGDVVTLGDDTIHSVANTSGVLTAAIHVYGGDFVNEPRSQWGPGPVRERPYDVDQAQQEYADANRAWLDGTAAD